MKVTFRKISNGQFLVLKDDKETKYSIFNGSAGMSGRGNNEYGISNSETGKSTYAGSLQKAKKIVTNWIEKE